VPDPRPAADPAALEPLRPGLHLIALRRLGGDADQAAEAVQEALARAVIAIEGGRLEDPARLAAFVAGILRHVIADLGRVRQRLIPIDSVPEPPSPDEDPLAALATDAERTRLRAALDRLAPADRELLRLTYFEGVGPSELAERLGERADRIRKRKSRALERLRAAFLGGARHVSTPAPTDQQAPTQGPHLWTP
jgi:RNA polymerase sigma-70 factor (ECF subfamily)